MNRLLYLSLAWIAIACSQSQKAAEIQQFDLSELIVDTLYLEKDTLTKKLGVNFYHFQTDSGEVLMTFNQHRLLTYSYPEGKILNSVKFEKEGPDGIGGYLAGFFIDQNNLYFLSQDQKLIEADFNGNVKRRIVLPETPPARLASNYSTVQFNPIFKSEKGLFIPDVPLVLKESLLEYRDWILDFSLQDSTFNHVSFSFPSSAEGFLDDPELGQYFHLYDASEKSHWISFSASDSILKMKDGKSTWLPAASVEKLEFLRGTTSQKEEWTAFHPNNESGEYTALQKDNQTGLIFRHAKIKSGDLDQNIRSKHVFIVLDSDGEIKTEIAFSDWDVSPYAFQTPNGIYFPIVAQLWEDQVPYARMDFSKIKP
jgi:hypothetical protein